MEDCTFTRHKPYFLDNMTSTSDNSSSKLFIADEKLAIPGVKERLVQITGHSIECIDKAKSLIDVTIKQNTSPIPFNETNDNNSENCCQFEEEMFATSSQYNITPSSVSSVNSNFETNDAESGSQHKIKLSLVNMEVDILVSDKTIGQKLEQFINKYKFADFIQNEPSTVSHQENVISIGGDSITSRDDSGTKSKDHATTIEYGRNFLFSLKEHAEKNSLRVINDIKLKDSSLYRS